MVDTVVMSNTAERTVNSDERTLNTAHHEHASRQRIRLTPRGRFVFFGLPTMALVVGMFLMLSALFQPAQATTGEPVTAQGDRLVEVTVAHGDTLWELAEHYAPERDVRDTVALIQKHNSFDGALVPGQKLVVPVSY